MNKTRKIILICSTLIFASLIFHPKKVTYVPKIEGKVIDQNGNPISNAIVARIEENSSKNKEFGYYEYEEFKSQIVLTDINGNFKLTEKSKTEWIHLPFKLPFVWCYADFEASKDGYETFISESNNNSELDKYSKYNKNQNGCENIEFNPTIILIKL